MPTPTLPLSNTVLKSPATDPNQDVLAIAEFTIKLFVNAIDGPEVPLVKKTIVMEYVEGVNIFQWLIENKNYDGLSEKEAIPLFK